MARGPHIGSSNYPNTAKQQSNGEPLRSTLAAQFVQHFTASKAYPKIQDQESFRQLLLEVLGADANQSACAEATEDDVDTNSKLIYS